MDFLCYRYGKKVDRNIYKIDDEGEIKNIIEIFSILNFKYHVETVRDIDYLVVEFLVTSKFDPREKDAIKPYGKQLMEENSTYLAKYYFFDNYYDFNNNDIRIVECNGKKCRKDSNNIFCESCFGEFGLNDFIIRHKPLLVYILRRGVEAFYLKYEKVDAESVDFRGENISSPSFINDLYHANKFDIAKEILQEKIIRNNNELPLENF